MNRRSFLKWLAAFLAFPMVADFDLEGYSKVCLERLDKDDINNTGLDSPVAGESINRGDAVYIDHGKLYRYSVGSADWRFFYGSIQ